MEELKIQIEENKFLGIEEAKGEVGSYTLYYSANGTKKYILSKYRPKEKIQQLLKQYESGAETVWLILGLELGYTIEVLLTDDRRNNKFIIIEPDEKILEQQRKYMRNDSLLEDPRIEIFTGDDLEFLKKIILISTEKVGMDNINIVLLENYKNVYPQYWLSVTKVIGEVKVSKILNRNTALFLLGECFYNIAMNRKYIQNSYDISQHKNKYKNTPALIVSAGPSLNKNIHLIKEFRGLIFTGGRTVEKVVEQGQKPSFLVSIDQKDVIYNTLGNLKTNDFPFVTLGVGNWQLPKTNYGPQYFIDNEGYNSLMEQLIGSRLPEVPCGGSVATMCLSLAHYMGCNPIVFIGQDLAFTDSQSHATGTYEIQKIVDVSEDMKYIPGYDGTDVLSDISLIEFLRWIEKFISNHDETLYINATEGGAKIKGTVQMPFQKVIEQYNLDKVEITHSEKLGLDLQDATNQIEKTLKGFQLIDGSVEKGLNISNTILKEYEKSKPNMQRIETLSKQLNRSINKQINECLKENIGISDIIKLVEHDVYSDIRFREPLQETTLESNIRTVKRAKTFYEEVQSICGKCINAINKALENKDDKMTWKRRRI